MRSWEDYLAYARVDLGLSIEEFWSLTPAEFAAMRYRLNVRFRHECFLAGIVASDYRNAHRTNTTDNLISPLDYVNCEEMSTEEIAAEEKEKNERAIQALVSMKAVREAA